jgi:hypothetical protein
MTYPFVIAASGAEGIIWLIVAFIWVLAQLFAAAKKKRDRSAGVTEEPESEETSQQVREFLEALTGTPVPPPPPPKAAIQKAKESLKKRKEEARNQRRPPIAAGQPAEEIEPSLPSPIYDEISAQRSMLQHTVLLPSISSLKLRNMRLASLSASGSLRHNRPTHALRPMLKGRQNLKAAMLSRIILGPPKSMDVS